MTETALQNKKLEQDKLLKEKELRDKRDMHEDEMKEKRKSRWFNLFSKGLPLGKHNDPTWYKQYVKDLDKFTNLSSWNRLGLYDLPNSFAYSGNNGEVTRNRRAAGLMRFSWVPSLGGGYEGQAEELPLNQILMRTKEQVLKSNSRSNVPYEAADLGLNFLAAGGILTAIMELERAIYIAQTYKDDNAYYAKGYLSALGYDSDDFLANLTDARKYLSILKRRFNSAIVAPANLAYYSKLKYLATSWIGDSKISPNAIYAFKASAYFKLNDAGDGLITVVPDRTVNGIYNQISAMIQVIAENPSYISMFSDLRSAFGGNLIQLDEHVDEDACIVVNTNDDAREQIVNLECLPTYYTDDFTSSAVVLDSLAVGQTESGFLYQGSKDDHYGIKVSIDTADFPTMNGGWAKAISSITNREKYINLYSESNGDKILDVTRFKMTFTEPEIKAGVVSFYIKSSDVAVVTSISSYNKDNSLYELSTDFITAADEPGFELMQDFSQYDWMPMTTVMLMRTNVVTAYSLGEIQNYFPCPKTNLEKLNQICILSEFFINADQFRSR